MHSFQFARFLKSFEKWFYHPSTTMFSLEWPYLEGYCVFRFESAFDRHSKHDTINNCSYNLTLRCLHVNYIIFINRSAAKLQDIDIVKNCLNASLASDFLIGKASLISKFENKQVRRLHMYICIYYILSLHDYRQVILLNIENSHI